MTPRRQARQAALQALYFAEVGGTAADAALHQVLAEHHPDAPAGVGEFAARIVEGVAASSADLDQRIAAQSTNWRIERLAVVDRLILRMAIWELSHEPETPPAVILNEAIELARTFGGDDSPRFVNGVLDAVLKA
jgi:N utilization substance protein B